MRQINLEKLSDDHKFQIVAYLVDREDFLKDVQSARTNLGLKKLIKYTAVKIYLSDLGKEAKQKGQAQKTLDCLQADSTDVPIITSAKFEELVIWFEKKYKKDSQFDMVMAHAILAGEIRDNELMDTAHVQYLDKKVLKNLELDGDFQLSIVVSRETALTEVRKLFNNEVQRFFKDMGDTRPRMIADLRRTRDWYWLKQHLTWPKLIAHIQSTKLSFTEDMIREPIREYRRKLKRTLYSSNSGDLTP